MMMTTSGPRTSHPTPEEDNDFRGMGRMILWPIVVLLVAIVIAALLK